MSAAARLCAFRLCVVKMSGFVREGRARPVVYAEEVAEAEVGRVEEEMMEPRAVLKESEEELTMGSDLKVVFGRGMP